MRALANPQRPAHREGTVDDTMLIAIGNYAPEGILPGAAETHKELETAEFYPVYVSEDPAIADHIALMLTINTQRPDFWATKPKCKVHNITATEWAERDKKL